MFPGGLTPSHCRKPNSYESPEGRQLSGQNTLGLLAFRYLDNLIGK
jgi:hypothetical protein